MPSMGKIFPALRRAIKESKVSRYRIAMDLGIDQGLLSRFMKAETGLAVDTVEKIADYLGLKITFEPKKGK